MTHALGPNKWEEVKQALQKACASRLTVKSDEEFCRITNERNGKCITFRYDDDAECIFYEGPTKSGGYTFGAIVNESILMLKENGHVIQLDDICFMVMRQVAGDVSR